MRPYTQVASLLAAAVFASVAHADTPTDFTITGTNTSTNSPYTISFALDPAKATAEYNDFSYFNVNASIDSVPDSVVITLEQGTQGNRLYIQEPNYGTFFESDVYQPNGSTEFFSGGALTAAIPTFNDGTYKGQNFISCEEISAVRTPHSMFPTAALLQLPVITTSCGESVTLTETTPSTGPTAPPTVTPEPSSLALLGTGALTTVGILRRRFSL